MKLFTVALFNLCTFSLLIGQIITEYSASNMRDIPDNYGKYEDWIEIYNDQSMPIDISGYGLSDKSAKPQKWIFPNGTIIAPGEYIAVWCSGRDELIRNNFHTNFKLTQTKDNEVITFSDRQGELLESIPMELTLLTHSRVKDADGNWQVATKPTFLERANIVDTFTFTGYTNTPIINQEAGFYNNTVEVTIDANGGEVVRYTLDGTLPTETSPIYNVPLFIEETTVVKARNFSSDPKMLPGKIDFKTYFINEEFSFPVFSIAADQLQDLANGNGEIRPIGSIEYFVDHELSSKSFGELNRHGQDSWVNPQRSLDWVSRDEMGYSKALQDELFSYSDRDEYQRFMLRASGDDNYPAINDEDHEGSAHIRDEYVHTLAYEGNMKLDLRAVERAIVFLNGDYWGLYSPRERPTDHDYTEYYYDQDKYNLQYLLTWGRTWAEYGGQQAFEDWFELRDFIMNNDMGIAEHYEYVKDNMQVLGLIDYMLINLNVVSSDWLNYNTGWWRGLDPDGDHKKWGYLLWDNDATFDFYINYSGVPNIQPDAEPCDIEEISEFMDEFFSFDNSFQIDSNFASQCFTIINGTSPYPNNDPIFLEVINELFGCCFYGWSDECQALYEEIEAFQNFDPNDCNAIQNGTCPYPATDSIFIETIKFDDYCCSGSWDITCEKTYQALSKGIYVDEQLYENVGQHEKIFLKLQDESEEFLQLYYSRQADLINTIFSCENMWRTLDIMSSAIAPEMPRHIQRWGGSMSEWEGNIEEMRNFISQRCELLDDGLINCYQLEGPYDLTIEVFPPNVGEIELNTLDLDRFPWTGSYYGNMENKIEAKAINSNFEFVKWQSKSGNIVFPSFTDEKATIRLMTSDTLIAVFSDGTTSIDEVNDLVSFDAYPSPAINEINIDFQVEKRNVILIQMFDVNGKIVYSRYEKNVEPNTVKSLRIDLETQNVVPGLYNIVLSAANQDLITKKIIVLE